VRLLAYFGEPSQPCGNCDNCLAPPETWDATDAARKALSTIYRTGQRFGAVYLIEVLRGRDGERVRRWGHEKLSVFGVGADLDEAAWRIVFRQLVALGLAAVDHDAHGALTLTEDSRAVLRGERSVEMRRHVARPRGAKPARAAPGDTPLDTREQSLFERLKAWRLAEARSQGVPPYVIFHDSTLAELARRQPPDPAALAAISGVGARKLERYGAEVLRVIAATGASTPQ
jgi:ATP-dependent DNA helicase RecQ